MIDLAVEDRVPNMKEVRSALTELIMRCVVESGELGVRKDELVDAAHEVGLFNDGTPDKKARLLVGFALGDAKRLFADDSQVMLCDPTGGSVIGYRYRLASDPEEARDDRLRRAKDLLHRIDNLDQVAQAEVVLFDSNEEIYEDMIAEGLRMARKGVGRAASARFADPPPEPPKKKRGRPRKVDVELEAQDTLL
jgi:hypothetical protein